MGASPGALTGLPAAVEAASGRWEAAGVGGVLVAAAAIVLFGPGRTWRPSLAAPRELAAAAVPKARLRERLRVGSEYRVTGWAQLDAAVVGGGVWPWIGFTALLLFVVTR